MHDKIEAMADVIMKKCLWQFHSRAWDRKRQNENIIGKATQLLCGEPVAKETPEDRCYWVDAQYLAASFRSRFPWLEGMGAEEVKALMRGLYDRIDHLTVSGSLNLELTDQHY